MTITSVTHIALHVHDVQRAEAFYCQLFDLDVAWREAETRDGWRTLPDGKTWEDAHAAGIHLDLVMLHRDDFALALEAAAHVQPHGTLSHIGILVDHSTFAALHERAVALGCHIVGVHERTLVFDDPYGVRWEPTVTPYTNPRQFSTGARNGQWLAV